MCSSDLKGGRRSISLAVRELDVELDRMVGFHGLHVGPFRESLLVTFAEWIACGLARWACRPISADLVELRGPGVQGELVPSESAEVRL